MTTSRTCALVSFVAAMIQAMALGACAGAPSHQELEVGAFRQERLFAIRFDNDGRDYVHVYLVSERREWLLGRVEPGAIAILRIPAAAFDEQPGLMRLAVIAGAGITLRAARDPRAQVTVAQPMSHILSQHWWFAQGQLTSLGRPRPRGAVGSR
jgi:hypothetical protein